MTRKEAPQQNLAVKAGWYAARPIACVDQADRRQLLDAEAVGCGMAEMLWRDRPAADC